MTQIKVFRGDDVSFTLNFRDANGNALDLTDSDVWFTVKQSGSDNDASAKIQKTVSSHTDATNGVTTVTLSNSDTAFEAGDYLYDFQLVDSGSNVTTYGSGKFTLLQDITLDTS